MIDEAREKGFGGPTSEPEIKNSISFFLVQTKDQPLSVASRHFPQSLKRALTRISRPWPDAVEQRRPSARRH